MGKKEFAKLADRKIAVDLRINELKAMLTERYELQIDGVYRTSATVKRGIREEIAELGAESQRIQARIGVARRSMSQDINHWFRQAAFENLTIDEYRWLAAKAKQLQEQNGYGPAPAAICTANEEVSHGPA